MLFFGRLLLMCVGDASVFHAENVLLQFEEVCNFALCCVSVCLCSFWYAIAMYFRHRHTGKIRMECKALNFSSEPPTKRDSLHFHKLGRDMLSHSICSTFNVDIVVERFAWEWRLFHTLTVLLLLLRSIRIFIFIVLLRTVFWKSKDIKSKSYALCSLRLECVLCTIETIVL